MVIELNAIQPRTYASQLACRLFSHVAIARPGGQAQGRNPVSDLRALLGKRDEKVWSIRLVPALLQSGLAVRYIRRLTVLVRARFCQSPPAIRPEVSHAPLIFYLPP